MINVSIIRLEESNHGTIGVLRINTQVICCSLEPPDRDNKPDISCIPRGTYTARRVNSPKYGNTFEITQVPDRTHILFHPGNTVGDTRGCVLLGQSFGFLDGRRAVLSSKLAFQRFLEQTRDVDEFQLEIVEIDSV